MMSTLKFKYYLSEDARKTHASQTGEVLPYEQTAEVELSALSPETRAQIVKLATLSGSVMEIDLHYAPTRLMTFKPSNATEPAAWLYNGDQYRFASVPTADVLIETAQEFASRRAELMVVAEEKAAQVVAEEKAKAERKAALEAEGLKVVAQAAALASNEQALRDLLGSLSEGLKGIQITAENRLSTVASHIRHYIEPFEEARKAEAEAKAEADREKWILSYGSDRLRRAFDGGYDVTRLYVLERAAKELPGWTVDFYDKAEWKERSNPTLKELDAADAGTALGHGRVTVVWLTAPPKDYPGQDERYFFEAEEFEQDVAMVNRTYHPKYDLIKML